MNTPSCTSAGSTFGATMLVSGCCIGAAMLGLPVVSAATGFIPSLAMFLCCWIFMVMTGFLILEVTLWFNEEVSFITMAKETLGKYGSFASWVLFMFLFYALMVAYVTGGGQLTVDYIAMLTGFIFPTFVGSILITLFFGFLLYLGTQAVDRFNRLLMVGLGATYLLLVAFGLPKVHLVYLETQDWTATYTLIPVMIISFGYHNLVPTLKSYLHGDITKLRRVILVGSIIPLFIYLLWNLIVLGLVPPNGSFHEALLQGDMATRVLRNAIGASWIVDVVEAFAFFALVTSFLAVALSFVDFFADGLKVEKTRKGTAFLCLLTLLPPLVCSFVYPNVFLTAINYAGGYFTMMLYGLLPVAMVWVGRYHQKREGIILVPGGRAVLILIALAALLVMMLETFYI